MANSNDFAKAVKERDEYHCIKCGYQPSQKSRLHAHHIIPDSLGGEDRLENGATLCATCHKFAPDYNTVIRNDAYEKAFEMFNRTWNPPAIDLFWFGQMASEREIVESSQFRKDTLPHQLPNLALPNWWIYFAAVADYKDARSMMPVDWSNDGPGVQTELHSL